MVNSDKRQRHKDGHRSRMEEARIAQARARRQRTGVIVGGVVVLIVVVFAVVSLSGNDDDQTLQAGATSTTAAADTTAPDTTAPAGGSTTLPAVSLPVAKAGASIKGDTPCPKADGTSPRTTSFAKAPPTCITKGKTYTATMQTSEGDIVIALDTEHAPIAANNFVVLARYHFYDGTSFHRIVPGFVNQGGGIGPDPGTSGPGYDLPKEPPTRKYVAGDVAMAASSSGIPSGSQFFLTIEPTSLNSSPNYPLIGTITTGKDVSLRINQFGQDDGGTGAPTKVVTISSVTIDET